MEYFLIVITGLLLGGVLSYIVFKRPQDSAVGLLKEDVACLRTENDLLKNSKDEFLTLQKGKIDEFEAKNAALNLEKDEHLKIIVRYEASEENKKKEHNLAISNINLALEKIERDRLLLEEGKESEREKKVIELKETWSRHESNVEEKIQLICQRQGIEYLDKEKFPYRGKPDNVVEICEELVVFDSKSPDGDNLTNFPSYIRQQAEAAKKYVKYEKVKNDIYLVVPTNAIDGISDKFMQMGDYRVHIISEDALEPILISLKKIEDYEFVDKLSPEDREKIVTTLGRMAHGMKRRIQVDNFFAKEFISVLADAENLPADFLSDAQQVEKSSKLNPPIEKRTKIIENKTLVKDREKIINQGVGQDIKMDANMDVIKNIPLSVDEKE